MHRLIAFGAASLLGAVGALAFANAPIGSLIENVAMPTLDGSQHFLLSDTNVSVFIFIKPGLEHSHTALVQIVQCAREMAGKPVHWSAVVSDRIPKTEVEQEVKATGLAMPILIDKGDALYGKLGVILHPVMGITDQDHHLVAYQPFAKVNYGAIIRARILHALKEISDQELEQVLQPPRVSVGGDASVAHRYLKLAAKQFQAGNYDQARISIQKSLDKDPTAAAHSLRGQILAAQGNRAEARAAFEAALKLDPKDPAAREGIQTVR